MGIRVTSRMFGKTTKSIVLAIASAVAFAAAGTIVNAQQSHGEVSDFGEGFVIALGGKLYDNLWAVVDTNVPYRRNPRFPSEVDLPADQTWRCVSCHGWDYKGGDGERAKLGRHDAFHSLRHLAGTDPGLIVTKIRAAAHDYPDDTLPDFVLEILALFISAGQYDRDALLDATGRAAGDPSLGRDIFEGACMNCHLPDGRAHLTGEPGDRSSLGWVARNRPEQALHKIRNGVPGADMLAVRFLQEDQIRDLFTYLQTLDPAEK